MIRYLLLREFESTPPDLGCWRIAAPVGCLAFERLVPTVAAVLLCILLLRCAHAPHQYPHLVVRASASVSALKPRLTIVVGDDFGRVRFECKTKLLNHPSMKRLYLYTVLSPTCMHVTLV